MPDFYQPVDVFGANDAAARSYALPGILQTAQQGQELGNAQAAQEMQIAAQKQQQEQAQQAQFHDAIVAHAANPTLEGARNLMLQFPQYKEVTAANYKGLSSEQRQHAITQMSSIAQMAESGDVAGALKLLQQRRDADFKAAQDTSGEDTLIAELQNPTEERRKMAVAHMWQQVAGLLPEDYAATLNATKPQAVGENTALVGPSGNVLYRAQAKPEKPQYRTVGGDIIQLGGDGPDPFTIAQQFVASQEGGIGPVEGKGNQSKWGVDTGANPEAANPNWTQADSEKLLHDKYWGPSGAAAIADPKLATAVYDTAVNFGVDAAQAMFKASGGDFNKLMDMRETRHKAIAARDPEKKQFLDGWLNRDKALRDLEAPNGAKVVYRGTASEVGKLDDDTLDFMSDQYLSGDKSVLMNLGRGAQGAGNVVALRKRIMERAQGAGLSPKDIAATMAEYQGLVAGERTLGTRSANAGMAVNEATQFVDLAREASAKVPRDQFLPFGKAQVLVDHGTNNPAYREFVAANNSLVNAYARAVSPTGTPTDSDKAHARDMLNTAYDGASYNAVLGQMQREMAAAIASPSAVRGEFRAAITGKAEPKSAGPKYPDGTVIKNDAGVTMVRKGGKWVHQ